MIHVGVILPMADFHSVVSEARRKRDRLKKEWEEMDCNEKKVTPTQQRGQSRMKF